MINKLLIALGLRKDVGGPVHAGANPCYFTYVYLDGLPEDTYPSDRWIFSWHDAAHKFGGSSEYYTQTEAETARRYWEAKKAAFEKATFVRP